MSSEEQGRSLSGRGVTRADLLASTPANLLMRGMTVPFAPDGEGGGLEAVLAERSQRREAAAADAGGAEAEAEVADAGAEVVADDDVDDAGGEVDAGGEEEDAEGEAEPGKRKIPNVATAEAPTYWSAEAKARFAELPADLQAVVLENEKGRETQFQKLQQQSVEARKAAETEAAGLKDLHTRITGVTEHYKEQFKRVIPELGMSWEEVDWPAWFAKDRATASAFRAQYDAEVDELQRLDTARQQTEQAQLREHQKQTDIRLKEVCPDLLDPKEGRTRVGEVAQFLLSSGVPPGALPWLTADELSIAYDAMRFRSAQAKALAQPKPNPAKPLRPSTPASHTNSSIKELEARAARTGSLDDTLALRAARRRSRG